MDAGTTVQITMPEMGESVTEGTILEWLKAEGDPVEAYLFDQYRTNGFNARAYGTAA